MARKKFMNDDQPNGSPEYMTTYGDMMTLLLCFFVLLFAFSKIDAQKFQVIMESFKGSAGILRGGQTLDIDQLINESTTNINDVQSLKSLKEKIENYLDDNNLENQIQVNLDSRGLLLRLNDNVLFDSGKAQLKPESKTTLRFLSNLLGQNEFNDKYIRVEGHTDSDPIISNFKYPTNWELSSIRAASVVRFFIEEEGMSPERFSIAGYSKYHPVKPNTSEENKAKNRRVDIVILNSDYLKSEPNY